MADTIVLAGAVAQKPSSGGHTWVFLQYLLGLKQLGWDVLFLDQLDPALCVDERGQRCPPGESRQVRYLTHVLRELGLDHAFSVLGPDGAVMAGLDRATVLERTRRSALLINVMGYLADQEVLGCAPKRVFLDIDPGFGQMWRALGLHDPFAGHDAFATIAENMGQPECGVPDCGLDWVTTRPMVVLDAWPACPGAPDQPFTSIATWRGAYGPIEFQGRTYGLRVHELRRFASLPRLSGQPFELALDIHPDEVADRALLETNGWALADPKCVARDPWAYQAYIRGSRAELMVAKNMYVQTRSGWFSDRSACYLASGRPVVAQDTGFDAVLPTGAGLLAFGTLDEAVAAVAEVAGDYAHHARAARALAEECFDSRTVLPALLAKLGAA